MPSPDVIDDDQHSRHWNQSGQSGQPYWWAFGEADIHLPPGWGSIPFREVLTRLPGYEGDLILDIKLGFRDYLGEGLETVKAILGDLEPNLEEDLA